MTGRIHRRASAVAPPRAVTRPSSGTEDDQLRWALWFAQADLTRWREGDWLNALEDVKALVTPLERRGSHPKRLDVAEVKARVTPLQKALRDLFEKLDQARHKAMVWEEGEAFLLPVPVPFAGQAILVAEHPFRHLRLTYAPKDRASVKRFSTGALLRVSDLLTRVDLSRLKRCPECKRLFLAVRRQRFDTRQCSLRDSQRRFRQKRQSARKK